MTQGTAYVLVLIVSKLIGPVMPAGAPVTVAAQAAVATVSPRSETWVLDSQLTLKDCNGALDHLPHEERPLWLAVDANDETAPLVHFDCLPEDEE